MDIRDKFRSIAGNRITPKTQKHSSDFPIDNKLGDAIKISDLVDSHTRRKNQRARIYEQVYRKCCQRIRYTNDVLYSKECVFKVPEVQLWGGIPRYQINAVLTYIMLKLKKEGFDTKFAPPDSIYINWARGVSGDSKYTQERNIIRYELDEVKTTVPAQLDYVATPRERLMHDGCRKDCCVGPDSNNKPHKLSRKEQLEEERKRQQFEIDKVINTKDRLSHR